MRQKGSGDLVCQRLRAMGERFHCCNGMLLRAADESGISYGIPETSEYIGENEKEKLSVIEAAGYGDLIDDYICEVPGRPLNRTMLDRLYEGVSLYLISKIRENMDIVSVGKGWTPVPASMEDWQSLPSQHTPVWAQKRLG